MERQGKIMINITQIIKINENEIHQKFIRASGPGGQNVNKVATAVQVRFDAGNSPSLPKNVRERLVSLAGKRITEGGMLTINARRFRTQEQNRRDAVNRLIVLIRKAIDAPKQRRKTRPTACSKWRRLIIKRRRSEIKQMRQTASHDE